MLIGLELPSQTSVWWYQFKWALFWSVAVTAHSTVCTNHWTEFWKLNTIRAWYVDGFRWDYLSRANTPNLDSLVENGLYVEKMIPTFQTKTFVNYYALATGLHAESSGIVSNSTLLDRLLAAELFSVTLPSIVRLYYALDEAWFWICTSLRILLLVAVTCMLRTIHRSFVLFLFNTVPLHSLKYNSQRLNRLVLVTNWSKELMFYVRGTAKQRWWWPTIYSLFRLPQPIYFALITQLKALASS